MRGFWSVYLKELYLLFASPIFYVVAFIFLLLNGYFFYSAMAFYNSYSFHAAQNPFMASQLNLTDMVLRPVFMDLSLVLLLVAPLLTMRTYAEERRSGTLELLFTLPVTDRAALAAKYGAVVTTFLLILAGTLPCMAILELLAQPNWKTIFSGYLGLVLLGCAFLSLGVFASSLTQNQIVAAVLSFGSLLMFWIIGWMKVILGPEGRLADTLEYLAITGHFDTFSKGILDSRDVVYYAAFILFFLFLSLRQVESCRWRG
ncbi:MAG: ABC transporter permease [Thermodesulfobacteriota bacterium]|nr:ABC transporter permease [Thermodesulfobacteriota bacterium]